MQLISNEKSRVISSGTDSEEQKFSIECSSKAFSILVDKLYTDKIGAIVRELGTNAYEAHYMCGKGDVPFEVKLPTKLDQTFKIRDFGPGLSEDEIYNLYTVIFKSSKTNTNDVGGAFGLGSKSPLGYTKNFIVNSYNGGLLKCYSIYINEDGIPSVKKLAEQNTNLDSGLEVIIPVSESDNYYFREAAKNVYKWFSVKPKINEDIPNIEYELKTEHYGQLKNQGYSYDYNRSLTALMGNVAYTIGNSGYNGKHKNKLSKLKNMVLFFNIGDVEPEPSRENIAFNPKTILAIDNKIDKILQTLQEECKKEINCCKTYWEAYSKYLALMSKFFDLITVDKDWNNEKLVPITIEEGLKFRDVRKKCESELKSFVLDENDKFYFVDEGVYKSKLLLNQTRGRYFTVTTEDAKKELSKKLRIDESVWVKTSSIPKITRVINRNSMGIGQIYKLNSTTSYGNLRAWDVANIKDVKDGYYVKINRGQFCIEDKKFNAIILQYLKKEMGDKFEIYGIKSSDVDKVLKIVNLKPIENFLEMVKIKQEDAFKKNCLYLSYKQTLRTIPEPIKKVEYFKKFTGFDKTPIDQPKYSSYINDYLKTILPWEEPEVDLKPIKEIEEKIKLFYSKYPLLESINESAKTLHINDYISIINKEKRQCSLS